MASSTSKQRKFYRAAVVAPFFDYLTGIDHRITRPEQAHEILKREFMTFEIIDNRGNFVAVAVRSTSNLTVSEMEEYIGQCRRWMWENFGVKTFDPVGNGREAA